MRDVTTTSDRVRHLSWYVWWWLIRASDYTNQAVTNRVKIKLRYLSMVVSRMFVIRIISSGYDNSKLLYRSRPVLSQSLFLQYHINISKRAFFRKTEITSFLSLFPIIFSLKYSIFLKKNAIFKKKITRLKNKDIYIYSVSFLCFSLVSWVDFIFTLNWRYFRMKFIWHEVSEVSDRFASRVSVGKRNDCSAIVSQSICMWILRSLSWPPRS